MDLKFVQLNEANLVETKFVCNLSKKDGYGIREIKGDFCN